MRLLLAAAVVSAVVSGVASAAGPPAGTLDVEHAIGVVTVRGSGMLLGRVVQGSVTVVDLSPGDSWRWSVDGAPIERRASFAGANVSFRILGGEYRLTARGSGISLSARGSGVASLLGVALPGSGDLAGVYSTDLNADCQSEPQTCSALPTERSRIVFGSAAAAPR